MSGARAGSEGAQSPRSPSLRMPCFRFGTARDVWVVVARQLLSFP